MTLLELLNQDGIKTRRIGKTYRARCPFHNGKTATSLSIDPEKGLYFCHGCGKAGDSIQWLRDFRGLSFQESCFELGREPSLKRTHEHQEDRPKPLPSSKWQGRAGNFVNRAVETLWKNKQAVSFLHGRGLRDETIRGAGLGWNQLNRYEDRASWGLEPLTDEKANVKLHFSAAKRLWLPAGLVIPWTVGGAVLRLRIRRPEGEPRYVIVSGSDMRPMIFDRGQWAVTVVESELDGLLIDQEAGDMAGAVALGSVQAKPDQETDRILKRASSILVSLDFDVAGARASWGYWLSSYPQARRWPVPYGKDPCEALQKGLNILTWIEAGLLGQSHSERKETDQGTVKPFPREWLEKYDETILERLAIMTVDGRLSDSETARILN